MFNEIILWQLTPCWHYDFSHSIGYLTGLLCVYALILFQAFNKHRNFFATAQSRILCPSDLIIFKIKNLHISCSIKQSRLAHILRTNKNTLLYFLSWTTCEENTSEPATGAMCEKRPSCQSAFSTVCSRSWCVVTGCDWHWEVWLARVCFFGWKRGNRGGDR